MNKLTSRLEKNIEKSGSCWNWKGYISPQDGYGRGSYKGNRTVAHKIVYEILVGKVKDGLTLDHLCRNRKCVNPNHLEQVTRGENVLRGLTLPAFNLLKTHCPKGHPYSGDNLVLENSRVKLKTVRKCRICKNRRRREWSTRNPGYWIKYQNKSKEI